jgi:hypothetical protein
MNLCLAASQLPLQERRKLDNTAVLNDVLFAFCPQFT